MSLIDSQSTIACLHARVTVTQPSAGSWRHTHTHIYTQTHTHTRGERKRERDIDTDRLRLRERERETDGQTHTHQPFTCMKRQLAAKSRRALRLRFEFCSGERLASSRHPAFPVLVCQLPIGSVTTIGSWHCQLPIYIVNRVLELVSCVIVSTTLPAEAHEG